MTDREMLEFAAKAAEVDFISERSTDQMLWIVGGGVWSPKHDDGDALRLAVKLQMELKVYEVSAHAASAIGGCSVCTSEKGDPYAATRRAIVRAAAEIGRNMV
jgi:hypothetical protein